MIQLYCGEGKGKTTACIGAAIRAAGREKKVMFVQFMKGQDTGEIEILRNIGNITVLRSEKDFPFFSQMSESQKQEMTDIHNQMLQKVLERLESGETDFVVLDEITHAVKYHMLSIEKLNQVIINAKNNEKIELLMSGREPSKELLEVSDYISRIECERHPFQKGVCARIGVEY